MSRKVGTVSRIRRTSEKIFDAIAAQLRLQILRTIYTQGSLSYVEIMNQVNLDPSKDAGKFAYHLRMLRRAGLIEANVATKKYKLTSLGVMAIRFSHDVEEQALRERRRLLVRTSRLAMEEFDRNRIVQALNREAGIPLELAYKIAEETEERLLKLDTSYLTAPLIREFVNAVLIEKGLQEYRHKLTRLGLPVYDVAQLIKKAERSAIGVVWTDQLMGKNVMMEYVLLDVLPRAVADAHLSGGIHLSDIDVWVLKPSSLQHDLRQFLRDGFKPSRAMPMNSRLNPPRSFEDAVAISFMTLCSSGLEVASEQGVNHFNLFLAPFVRNTPLEALKDALHRFLLTMNHSISNGASPDVSLGLDFSVPTSLQDIEAPGPDGKNSGAYGEYLDESLLILEALFDLVENEGNKPLLHPQMVLNLAPPDLENSDVEALLLKAHRLAAKYGTPYFINLWSDEQMDAAYFASGIRLAPDWTGDWELDTMRAGNLGTVVINLPRLVYQAKNSEKRLYTEADACVEMAIEALTIRHSSVKERIDKHLLPFLSQQTSGEAYLRVKNSALLLGFVGLNEAIKAMTGRYIYEDEQATDFAVRIVDHLTGQARKLSERSGLRVAVSQSVDLESPQRLAELDVETWGWGTVIAGGTRLSPYYTDGVTLPLEAEVPLRKRLSIDSQLHPLLAGGHLSLIEVEDVNPEALLKLTREICRTYHLGAYAFTRSLGYCFNCQETFYERAPKCPSCKGEDGFVRYSRLSSKYLPLGWWPAAKKEMVDKRIRHRLT